MDHIFFDAQMTVCRLPNLLQALRHHDSFRLKLTALRLHTLHGTQAVVSNSISFVTLTGNARCFLKITGVFTFNYRFRLQSVIQRVLFYLKFNKTLACLESLTDANESHVSETYMILLN